uniref:Growth-regulating factor n=1 Tax=Oryza rufipogon TaxID=4529 RepID=A0A0E0NLM9_ORYRU
MMMMSGRPSGGAGGGRYPFTASQWQELEHQALIYKYMASGTPIPSDLILPLRRSFLLDSALATSPSLAFPPQPSLGWGCFGMGFGRKAEDPEPGRCRRTDGKKWRCSKEAYPDSKYCEKHMHRGKNRSRKPVEMSLATPPPPSSSATSAASNTSAGVAPTTTTTSSPAPSYSRPAPHDAAPYQALYGGPYAAATARTPAAAAYHAQVSPFHLQLDTTHPHPPPSYYSMDHKEYAYGHATKEVHGEHAFFSDGTEREHHHAAAGHGHSSSSAWSPSRAPRRSSRAPQQQQQHCFLLGADLRLEKPAGHDHAAAAQKPLRHFFDEWPHEKNSKGSWMGLEGETQLSMSIPMAANDLPITTTSRYHNDD